MMNYEKLKELLEEKQIAQRTIADAVGCTEAMMSYIVKGFKSPSVELLKRIADYLGVTVDELLKD